jgi:hypothetical protein
MSGRLYQRSCEILNAIYHKQPPISVLTTLKHFTAITVRDLNPGLRLAQPGNPADKSSVLLPPYYLKTEAESSFGNVVVL